MDGATPKPIVRVDLACKQCRNRHVKCDATQPACNRCLKDGKECTYLKSRRGGLDKAALARRRQMLQRQAAERSHQERQSSQNTSLESSNSDHREDIRFSLASLDRITLNSGKFVDANPTSYQLAFQISTGRLLDMFYDNYWAACPVPLPLHYLNQRRLMENHGMDSLLVVLEWIGSIIAPWASSDAHYQAARTALESPTLPLTPWSVQALMMFCAAQRHSEFAHEARKFADLAISMALALQMNTKEFVVAYGEGDPVLEESWRRTYYFLALTDQHFAIVTRSPMYALMHVPNTVDLPCDDEYYLAGDIPLPATWQQYDTREFDEIEVIYSSITYMADVSRITRFVMEWFLNSGTLNDALVAAMDAKLAVWQSLLPASKKDPVRADGSLDEVLFLAHLMAAVLMMTCHRPFSSLSYSAEELTTEAFTPAVPVMGISKNGRSVHTARTLKACDMQTRLLAIPCAIERHSVFTICIVASIAAAQIAACSILQDHALSIARDRVRLSIGFLNATGALWPLARKMAKEVRFVARRMLTGPLSSSEVQSGPVAEIEMPRDEVIWPIDPSVQVDIYAGLTFPLSWDAQVSSTPGLL